MCYYIEIYDTACSKRTHYYPYATILIIMILII